MGSGRFRPPLTARGWTGERRALREGPACPQPGTIIQEEDCLHLSVWTRSVPLCVVDKVTVHLCHFISCVDSPD